MPHQQYRYSWVQNLSWENILKIFRNFKHTVGLYYPSKRFVTNALSSALIECSHDDLMTMYTKLKIVPPNTKSVTILRLKLLENVMYSLYSAPIKLWNVVMTSGLTLVILFLIEKLLYAANLQNVAVMDKIVTLVRIAYLGIGSVAISTIFIRWLQSKQLRNRVIRLLDYIQEQTKEKIQEQTKNAPKQRERSLRAKSQKRRNSLIHGNSQQKLV
jgi:hypothetical protein